MISDAEAKNRARLEEMMRDNLVAKGMRKIELITQAVARGVTDVSQYFSGPAGVGKTTTVTRILEEEKAKGGRDYVCVGDASPEYLLEIFQRAADKGLLVVLDDSKILKDVRKRDILQYAISSPEQRQPYMRGSLSRGEEVYDFKMVTVIVCTNTPSSALSKALSSRFQATVDIPDDHDAIFWYTCYAVICCNCIGRLPMLDLKLAERKALFALFCANQHKLKDVSPRKLIQVAKLMRVLPMDWRDELDTEASGGTLYGKYLPEAQRPELII